MRKIIYVLAALLAIGIFAENLYAQDNQDVVYLKNGSIIKGTIVEEVPGVSLKIKTKDGSLFVYQMDEVEKITKEEKKRETKPSSVSKLNKKFNIIIYTGLYIAGVSVSDPSPTLTPSSILLWHLGVGTEFTIHENFTDACYIRFIRKGAEDVYDYKGAYIIGNYLEIENALKFGLFASPIKPYALMSLAIGFKLGATGYSPSGASVDYSDYLTGSDFGLYFGAGAEIPATSKFSIEPEVKYWLGLSDVNDNNQTPKATVKSNGFQINVGAKIYF